MKKDRRRKVSFLATDKKIVFYAPKQKKEEINKPTGKRKFISPNGELTRSIWKVAMPQIAYSALHPPEREIGRWEMKKRIEDYGWEDPRRIYKLPFIPTMACAFGFIIGSAMEQMGFGFLSAIVLLLMFVMCAYYIREELPTVIK